MTRDKERRALKQDGFHVGLFTGTGTLWVWVLLRLFITVHITANTIPVKETGMNPFKTYTVLE
jgi:hypothetical protein